jgi:hypothetical protein
MNLFYLRRFSLYLRSTAGSALAVAALCGIVSAAGAQSEVHGRGWKPLPPTAHIVVTVLKGFNGKPLSNAAVVFHAVRNGKNDGNLEVKTDEEGKAAIDVIEIGSHLNVQVIASGFATSATEMDVDGPEKALEVKMLRPRAQVSKYQDVDGKPATEKPGIQEPAHGVSPSPAAPKTTPTTPPVDPTAPTAVPAPAAPPANPPLVSRLNLPAALFQQPQTPAPSTPPPPVSSDPAATAPSAAARTTRPAASPLAAEPNDGPHRAVAPPAAGPATAEAPTSAQRTGPRAGTNSTTAAPLTDYQRTIAQPVGGTQTAAPLSNLQRSTTQPSTGTQVAAPLSEYQRSTAQPVGGTPTVTALPVAPPQTGATPSANTPTVVPLRQNAPQTVAPLPGVVPLPRTTIQPADAPAPAPTTPPSAQQ